MTLIEDSLLKPSATSVSEIHQNCLYRPIHHHGQGYTYYSPAKLDSKEPGEEDSTYHCREYGSTHDPLYVTCSPEAIRKGAMYRTKEGEGKVMDENNHKGKYLGLPGEGETRDH